jgi:ElaB/YqjD/DUF883 family membrane-anchored ribosome-binding protein
MSSRLVKIQILILELELERMFTCFKSDDVESKLNCPGCKLRYVDPRILTPCFETLCLKCIQSRTDPTLGNEIECPFCQLRHPIPEGGYFPNKVIVNLLQVNQSQLYTSQQAQRLGKNLVSLKSLAATVEEKMTKSGLDTHNRFTQLKAQVNLVWEQKRAEIGKIGQNLFKNVEDYEMDRKAEMNAGKFNVDDEREFIQETEKQLRNSQTDGSDFDELNSRAEKYISCWSKKLNAFQQQQATSSSSRESSHRLQFHSNELRLDEKLIGTLENDKTTCQMTSSLNEG